ncbi:dUTP diphosphatase [Paenibacillus sp. YN15]|uniref:dUTP diphosphatase n=1 Tax=Paenibacillus sp. YN15 TaxID=1742774 RepID=UPI000DCC4ADF|nr:deoxyuridine 5'-triphosphate nucleotidohydrolase [Paenibacillus sp. YN15]RAU96816.1 deoxyuridine 5'-triphosphate nucleotidohydrolase [Paenibacillus sp. YN15]
MKVKIRRLSPDAVIPKYATQLSAGFDLVAVEDVIIEPGATSVKVPLGLSFELPPGYVMYVMMRSGIALRTKLRQSNGIGVIDADYRGEVAMLFDNVSRPRRKVFLRHPPYWNISSNREGTYIIRKGDRIAQGVIQRYEPVTFVEVAELSETERGAGGFGSTGVSITEVSE